MNGLPAVLIQNQPYELTLGSLFAGMGGYMNPQERQKWFAALVDVLRTHEQPREADYRQMQAALKAEVLFRCEHIWETPVLKRRKHRREDYHFRKAVMSRDGSVCTQCKQTFSGYKHNLQIAHILPVRLFPEYAFQPWNGQVLCHDCHKHGTMLGLSHIAKNIKRLQDWLKQDRRLECIPRQIAP